jgi:esterase/lipase superfamily enzyme
MHHLPIFIFPFVLAATRSLALGVQSPSRAERRAAIPADMEYQFLTIVTFCLLGLLVALNLIVRFPDFGTVIAEYNQF